MSSRDSEPTAVLAPPQVEDLFRLLRELRDGGTTILFISHKLREVMALADRVTVIRMPERDEARPPLKAFVEPVLHGHLHRDFDGNGARIIEENVIQVAGQQP